MTNFFNFDFFGNNSNIFSRYSANKKRSHRGRTCRIEELEGREMLSVTPWTLTNDYIDYDLQERADASQEQADASQERADASQERWGASPPVENVLVESHRQASAVPLLQATPSLSPLGAAPDPYDATLSEAELTASRASMPI